MARLSAVDGATQLVLVATAVAVPLSGYSLVVLIPRLESTDDEGFARYHRQSVI